MDKYIQQFQIETGLTLTWESSPTQTSARAFDESGSCVGYRTFGAKQLRNTVLVDTVMNDFIAQTKLSRLAAETLLAPLPDSDTLKAVFTHQHPDAADWAPDQ